MTKLIDALAALNALADENSPIPNIENKGNYQAFSLYDKLVDYVDYVQTYVYLLKDNMRAANAMSANRRGRTALFKLNLDGMREFVYPQQYTRANDLRSALEIVETIRHINTLQAILNTAKTMRDNLAPLAFRRRKKDGSPIAQGTIQIKSIRNGTYMYYRYWVTSGSADKQHRRLKNEYIGLSKFVETYLATKENSLERRDLERKIIEHYELIKNLDPKEKKRRRKEFEQQLIDEYKE